MPGERLDTSAERYFRDAYQNVMYSGTIGRYSHLVHTMMERRYRTERTPTVLELGAGAGQHLPYVRNDWDTYYQTDLDPSLAGAVLAPGGTATIYVPAEPGMALRALRHGIVAPKARRYGQDHLRTIARDHRNHYPMMRTLIDDVFAGDRVVRDRFPLPFVGWNAALFEIAHIRRKRPA